jgi:hypothetical protein
MSRFHASILGTAVLAGLWMLGPQRLGAQTSVPDFSGVYYPVQSGRGGPPPAGAQRGGPPPRPTASAPLADGSRGRAPDAPKLTPEYMTRWEMMRKSRMAGSYEFDNSAKCLPPGMPAMMNMAYGMEVMQTRDKITFFSELNDALRRVYLDGRRPSAAVLEDPTYAGYSTGHWEGDTLVVETVALHPDSFIEGFTPHSDEMTVRERIRFIAPDVLEDRITVTDPKALTEPWETVRTYRKARPGKDELREFACAEGLTRGK